MRKIYKLSIFITVLVMIANESFGQLPMTRTTFTGGYTQLNTGAPGGGIAGTAVGDDVYQNGIPIGFSFNYLGTNYTTMSASSNGWASFLTVATSDAANTDLSTTSNNLTLGLWWDDLRTDSMVYKTSGSPGTQTFVIQWYAKTYYTTATQQARFQLRLYEGTNVIEFLYGTVTPGVSYTSESASIGIKGAVGGNGNYLDAVTGSAFVSTAFLAAPGKWPTRNYRFTPGSPAAIAGGTYNVGTGQVYPTIDEAVADVNHRGVSGAVVFALTQSLYDITPANGDNILPVFFGPITGSSPTNSILVQPAIGTSTLSYDGMVAGSGANAASTSAYGTSNEPIIGIVGSNNVTIRNLVLTCTQPSGTNIDRGVSIMNQSSSLGTSSCTVRNVTVTLNRSNTSSIAFESITGVSAISTAGSNSYNRLMDIGATNCYSGILLSGTAAFPDLGNSITTSTASVFNTIGSATANDIGNGSSATYGIQALNQSSVTINNNNIQNITVTSSVVNDGIFLNALQGTSNVFNNKISNIKNTSTSATSNITGIRANIATTGTHEIRVYNNFVGGIISGYTGAASATRQMKGIYVQSAGGGVSTCTINVDFNNVSIDGSASPNISSTAYEIGTATGPVINTRNNIFANFTGAQTAPAQHLTWVSTSATAIGNTGSISNYNDLYIANATQGNVGMGAATIYAVLINWQAGMTQDANSIVCAPSFNNNVNDLHVAGLCLNSAGSNIGIPWVINDIDNVVRGGPPDIGADEFFVCSSVLGGTTTPGSYTVCVGQNVNLTNVGATSGGGISYQWQSSPFFGGPYTNVVGGVGATSPAYITPTLSPGNYFYQLVTTCGPSSLSATSNTISVTVNSLPVVSVTPSSATICVPGGTAVTLNASGANTYTWSPGTGLTGTVGASVGSLPPATTIYTVTGTDAFGCVNTSTTTVNINESPSFAPISASSTLICGGGNSSLQAVGALTSSYAVTSITYAPIPTPTTGVTILDNLGVAVTPLSGGSLDDGYWSNLPIPFNFNFFGTTYNTFAVGTNGYIFLGSGNPGTTTGYNNVFPSTTPNRPCIAAIYSDLDWDGAVGTIQTFTTGVAPNRKLVVNYTNGQFWSNTGSLTAQAIIYETSNIIEVHTFQSTAVNPAVEGIQNAAGTLAFIAPGRNNVNYAVAVPDAYRWSPAGGPVSYSWSPATYLNFTNISNPVANTVTSSIIYTAVATATNGCSNSGTISIFADVNPTLSIAGPTAVCSGNSLSLTASGAVNYTWSTGAITASIANTPTANVTYSVVGTNTAGCSGTAFQSVTVNLTPTITIAGNNTVCAGQPVLQTANGANSYSWSTGALTPTIAPTPTANTTYSVIGISIAGCSATAAQNVTLVALPTVTITSAPSAICVGQTATLIASASGADTYSWSNGANIAIIAVSPTVNTAYTITVGSNITGCTNFAVQTLTVNPIPNVAITGPTVICLGNIINLNASGANTYLWSNGANTASIAVSPTVNTTYTVTGTSTAGCVGSAVQSVSINPVLLMIVSSSTSSICVGTSANLFANGANSYTWSTGANTGSIIVSPTVNTTYTVTGTSSITGCSDTKTISITVDPCLSTGVAAVSASFGSIAIYPNPNNGEFTVELNNGLKKEIQISDVTGRVISTITDDSDKIKTNINTLANGVYYVKVSSGSASKVFKIIKE